jgi:hypothetical protein
MLKDTDLIMILVNLTGAFGGVFLLAVAQPVTDFYFLLPVFVLAGLAVANLVLALMIQVGRELNIKME